MGELVIDPRCDLRYYTFLVRGIRSAGYARRLRFARLDAPAANGMAMELRSSDRILRIFADTGDRSSFAPEVPEWADRYGKTNLDHAPNDEGVVLLGPTFGIREWSLPAGYLIAVRMAAAGAPFRQAVAQIRYQAIARCPIDAYRPAPSDPRYIFHASRPWSGHHVAASDRRQRFFAACDSLGVEVDGGFLSERLPLREYIERTRRSALVFNCPALHGCLGWKLGEYLALGKAIISTPLRRELPSSLVHGEHVHFVDDNEESIAAGVDVVLSDLEYRAHLERGARSWYKEHLRPEVVAHRLCAPSFTSAS